MPCWAVMAAVRSYRAFERALIGGVDSRSVIELALVHRLSRRFPASRGGADANNGKARIHGVPVQG